MVLVQHPFKMAYNEADHLVEVIVSTEDFLANPRSTPVESDWESMPGQAQSVSQHDLVSRYQFR